MEQYVIKGGNPLNGEVEIGGAKNAALAILAAAIMTDETVTIENLPNVRDINVLLIDEPDSHTHTKVQKKLIKELRKIDNTQTLIITHNDVFVSEAKENELYFLNKEVITIEKELKPLEIEKFNSIKSDLGGVILQLEQLNNSKKIIFVEGNDDEKYIEIITSKYNDLFNSTFEYAVS